MNKYRELSSRPMETEAEDSSKPLFEMDIGDVSFAAYKDLPDFKRHKYEFPDATNENLRGLRERSELIKDQEEVSQFLAVGRPEKLIAQAVLLRPKNLTLMDIDNQNVLDGLTLFNALRQGVLVEEFFKSNQKQIEDLESNLLNVSYQGYHITSLDRWRTNERLYYILKKIGISFEEAVDVMQNVSSIRIARGNIKDPLILKSIFGLSTDGIKIGDFSNIPIPTIPQDVRIFSALNCQERNLADEGIGFGITRINNNVVWNYPDPNSSVNNMAVAYSPNYASYQEIAKLVNPLDGNFKW
ncbi:MAG: hypothetical protein WCX71_04820 [Candidatus Buchananbacteria bacterium]